MDVSMGNMIFRNSQHELSNYGLDHHDVTLSDRLRTAVPQRKGGVTAALVALGLPGSVLVGALAHADPDLLDAASSAATSAITIDELLEQQLGILGNTFVDTVNSI